MIILEHFTMGQEDAVYLAKLAEQAERYEGMKHQSWKEKGKQNRA